MKRREAIYKALGFPIIIENPKYIEFEGDKVLDVDPEEIQNVIFAVLITKPARLSGAEVRFMRTYMEATQEVFGKSLLVDASTVSKWESYDQQFCKMPAQTELLLRMRCKLYLNARDRIAASFMDNLTPVLEKEEAGDMLRIAI